MSIQLAKSGKILNKIQEKLKINRLSNILLTVVQKLYRTINHSKPKVYYSPITLDTHPYIKDRMYGANAPLKWGNFNSASVAHYLQFPQRIDSKYLVEPNDHILTLGVFFGAKMPSEILKRVDDIKDLIASSNFKGILIGDDGLESQYKHYFGNSSLEKLYKFEQMRCLPKVDAAALKNKTQNRGVNFLFLASDYRIKAVDLLITAWSSIKELNGSKLIIACHNIPEYSLAKIEKIPSITLIKSVPLNKKMKADLLRRSDVTFCLTHADAFANAFEGLEYGHPIIASSYHRSQYITKNENGLVIDFPNEFYRPGEYGVRYDSIAEYLDLVTLDQKNGKYELSTLRLAQAIEGYINDSNLLLNHSLRSLELAQAQSVSKSNETLMKIYKQCMN
jgi:hypothetical protein